MSATRFNPAGLVTAFTLILALLVLAPLAYQQNRLLLNASRTMADLDDIRLSSRKAWAGETRVEDEQPATALAIADGVLPTSWTQDGKARHPFGQPVSISKLGRDNMKMIAIELEQLSLKECSTLLWRLSDRLQKQRWVGIYINNQSMATDLTPAESAVACKAGDSITLTFKY